MVGEDLDLILYSVEIYFLFSIYLNYCKEFLIVYFIVKFGFYKLSREISDRV